MSPRHRDRSTRRYQKAKPSQTRSNIRTNQVTCVGEHLVQGKLPLIKRKNSAPESRGLGLGFLDVLLPLPRGLRVAQQVAQQSLPLAWMVVRERRVVVPQLPRGGRGHRRRGRVEARHGGLLLERRLLGGLLGIVVAQEEVERDAGEGDEEAHYLPRSQHLAENLQQGGRGKGEGNDPLSATAATSR